MYIEYVCFIFASCLLHYISNQKSPTVVKITDRTGCQWPSRSLKVNDFHLIWQGVCHFLLVINSNLGPIIHRLATVHPRQTDSQTEEQTDRRTTTMTIARPLPKCGRLKTLVIAYQQIPILTTLYVYFTTAPQRTLAFTRSCSEQSAV